MTTQPFLPFSSLYGGGAAVTAELIDGTARTSDTHRCVAGEDCRGKTSTLPALTETPNTACQPCIEGIGHAIGDLTETWICLHAAIGDQTRRQGQKVSGSRTPPINLNTDVDALKTDIIEWLVAAAARMADILNVDDPYPRNNTDTEHARVLIACTNLITPHIPQLLALPADDVTVWLQPSETDRPGESLPTTLPRTYRPNTSIISCTGMFIALRLVELRRKARAMLALNAPTDRLTLPCPYCNHTTLIRRHFLRYSSSGLSEDEVDRIDCSHCGIDWPYSRYQQLCEIWVREDEMEREKLQRQLDTETQRRETAEARVEELERQFSYALTCTDIPASVFAQEVLTATLHDSDSLMSSRDLAPIVGVAESTIRAWASQGRIGKHVGSDGSMLFHAKEVWDAAKATRRRTGSTAGLPA